MTESKHTFPLPYVLRLFLLLGIFGLACLPAFAQYKIAGNKISIKTLFKQIESKTGYAILYQPQTITGLPNVSLSVEAATINTLLDRALKDLPLNYVIIDKTILVKRNALPTPPVKDQTIIIYGTVADQQHLPLSGVTIRLKNSANGCITDAGGRFSCRLADIYGALVFSVVGYTTQEIDVKDLKVPVAIIMNNAAQILNQVQVTAYGTTSKQLNPGNITTLKSTDINVAPVTNILEAIQGKVPGLFIQQNTGTTGGDYTLKIRSSANFTATAVGENNNNPQPMILVDGVTIPVGSLPQLIYGSTASPLSFRGGNFLNYLNPSDIESIDVLKDADATAIYGSRGAYGVIIITTKKAAPGKSGFGLNVTSGFSVDAQLPHLLNTDQYIALRKDELKNDGHSIGTADEDINGTWSPNRNINWPKVYQGNHTERTDANLSYNGGSDLTNFMLSANFRNRQDVQLSKGAYKEGELRFSMNNHTADNLLSINLTGGLIWATNSMLSYDLASYGGLYVAPNAPALVKPDGSLDWDASPLLQGTNVMSHINTIYKNNIQNLLGSSVISYHPLTHLWLKSNLGYNQLLSDELSESPTSSFAPSPTAGQYTSSIFNHYRIRSVTINAYAEYAQTIATSGNLNLKVGGEINSQQTDINSIDGQGFSSDALLNNPGISSSGWASSNTYNYRNIGFFGIAKIVWDDQYIVDVNVRRDGSSRFGEANRFGNFGSVGAAWILSGQHWLKENMPWISFAKLRASAGIVGGDALPNYAYLAVYNQLSGTYAGKLGLSNSVGANPNIQWEKNKRINAALELGLFQNRIYLQADFYNNHSSNELVNQPSSSVTGTTNQVVNTNAVIQTSGWEFSLTTRNIHDHDFSWTSNFNISIPHSKLLSLPNANANEVDLSIVIGKPIGGIFLYKYAGVNPQTGNYNFTNAAGQTGEHIYDLGIKDQTQFLDLSPKFFGGFQNTFRYHRLQLDLFFTFTKRQGESWWGQNPFLYSGSINSNPSTDALRRWRQPGDATDIPRISSTIPALLSLLNFSRSTGAYTDASYIRLQQLGLRYDLTNVILKKSVIKSLSINLAGQNLFTITRYKNGDPETLNSGVLPILTSLTAGINAAF